MLETLRRQTGSWVVKGFLALLALSFGVWGIGDIFRGPRDPTVAEVGAVKIHASELQREYTRTLEMLRRASGGQIDAEQARAMGAVDRALDTLVARAAMRQEIDRLSLGVPDETVRREITNTRAFRSEAGNFDRMIYEAVLRQNRLSEDEYVGLLRRDLARAQLTDSLAAGLVAPEPLVHAIHDFREERRIVDAVTVDAASITDVPEPDEAAISAYYDEHHDQFTAPEYRRVSFVAMRPGDLLDEVKVPDEDVREEYEYRLDEFTTKPRRDIDRMVFDDEAAAKTAVERVNAGEDFLAVGAELTGQTEADMQLGTVTREDMVDEVAEPAFALPVGTVSAPIETPFGWYVLRVNSESPGGTRPFEEVADDIRGELKIQLASDANFELSNRFEDARAGGAQLEEAARTLDLQVRTVGPVDQRGHGPDGKPVSGLPAIPDFLDTAFGMAQGTESELKESLGTTFYALRVDEITPPALRPLAEVREQVAEAWRAERRREHAHSAAEQLAAQAKDGGLAAAAAAMGYEVQTSQAFARDGRDLSLDLSAGAVSAVFALDPGGVTDAIALGPDRYLVAEVKEVVPAPAPADDKAGETRIAQQLQTGMQADLMAGLEESLRHRYGVRVNNQLVDSLF